MYKIKKQVPHDCNKHFQIITQIFQGYEETESVGDEMGEPDLKFALMLQCSLCKRVAVTPYQPKVAPVTPVEPVEPVTPEVTEDAEVKEPEQEVIQEG